MSESRSARLRALATMLKEKFRAPDMRYDVADAVPEIEQAFTDCLAVRAPDDSQELHAQIRELQARLDVAREAYSTSSNMTGNLSSLAIQRAPLRAPEGEARHGLTFSELTAANLSRVVRWHPGGLHEWTPLEWAGAMAGESGEACNAAKKLKRIDGQIANINLEPGRSLTEREAACKVVANEVADTVVYGALLCSAVGQDLGAAIIEVFNRKSEEYGFPERLSAAPAVTEGAPPTPEVLARIAAFCRQTARDGVLPSLSWFTETADALSAQPTPQEPQS